MIVPSRRIDHIAILNTTSSSVGKGATTSYRIYFNTAVPKATYNKLTSSLQSSINSGYFTESLKISAKQMNITGVGDVVTQSVTITTLC